MQLGPDLWDLEWTNGTSFYFDRAADSCRQINFTVGILTPDWLNGAIYRGHENVSSHLCNVWQKGQPLQAGAGLIKDPKHFITYWADASTNQPVRWQFFDGALFDILTWEEGKVLSDEQWQAPQSCFAKVDSDGHAMGAGSVQVTR